jgi:thymidylate synthase ThyX
MSYNAQVLADSVSPGGVRLLTFAVTFPRFILAEFNTHRALSRNSASSRAIPPEKHIQRLFDAPFVPVFGSRVTGMGEGELDDETQTKAQALWLQARDHAAAAATALNDLRVDKSHINRLIEPFMWHTAIVSGTEFGNLYGLRTEDGAQKEFRVIAELMILAADESESALVEDGEWHVPLVSEYEVEEYGWDLSRKLSASRCARVSYDRQHESESIEASLKRHDALAAGGHLSPFEHTATPDIEHPQAFTLNFRGWRQYRYFLPYQADYSLRPPPDSEASHD